MPTTVRRPAPKAQAPAGGGSVNFGDDSFYLGGLGIPEGNYATRYFVDMFTPRKLDGTPTGKAAFLAVHVEIVAIEADGTPVAGAEPTIHPLGCGRKAHQSFLPSEDGKGFDPKAGATSTGLSQLCNWAIFRKSLVDAGMPPGTLVNNLATIDGAWLHIQNVPEPEERKALRSRTGEAALEDEVASGSGTVPVVSEILEGGAPWDGGGGWPLEEAPAPTKAAPKAPAKPGPRPVTPAARKAVAPPPEPEETESGTNDEEIRVAAMNGISEVLGLEKNANGCTKLTLRAGVLTAVTKAESEDMASAVLDTFFATDAALNSVLNPLGYAVAGGKIAPQ